MFAGHGVQGEAGGNLGDTISIIDFNEDLFGGVFIEPDGVTLHVPNVGSLDVNCSPLPTKQPDPGDSDQDGCSDVAENGSDPLLGGQRNYLYFWDFYDVWTRPQGDPNGWERNRVLNVFDILATARRFGPGDGPPPGNQAALADALAQALVPPTDDTSYHPAYDRGPIIGANGWNRGGPDAGINVVDDILGIARQFGHNCA